jgi:hypothetical protein
MNNEHYVYKQESQNPNNIPYSPIYSNQHRQQPQNHQQQLPQQQYQHLTDYPGIAIEYGYSGLQFPLYSAESYTAYPPQQQIPKYYPQSLPQHQQLQNLQHSHTYQQPLQQQAPLDDSLGNNIPRFIRTSEVRQGTESLGYTGITRMMLRTGKAKLKIYGNLNEITGTAWTPQELSTSRRLVRFERNQKGSEIELRFEIMPYHEYHEDATDMNSSPGSKSLNTSTAAATTNRYCIISCIQQHGKFYFTSVDCILLLEKLIGYKFGTDEKNRIRRNLEGYKPITISKSNIEFEGFFNLIKSYTDPKPINILKDVKVFEWYLLERALEKIISKYSACYDGRQQQPQQSQQMPPQQPYQVREATGLGGSAAYTMMTAAPGASSASNYTGFIN